MTKKRVWQTATTQPFFNIDLISFVLAKPKELNILVPVGATGQILHR
jgi:hypothetical protein